MLPDFPKLKMEIKKNILVQIQAQSQNDPMINAVSQEKHYEGDKTHVKGNDGFEKTGPYTKFESPADILNEDIIKDGPQAFLKHGFVVAEDLKRQMVQSMLGTIEEGVKRIGNTIDQKGQPLSPEHILKALETMSIAFNDDGSPQMPQFYIGEQDREKFQKVFQLMETDQTLISRKDEILRKKKEEWDAAESDRKLVD